MSRRNRFALLFLALFMSGCNGMPKSERKIFNEMRYTVHLYSVDNTDAKGMVMHKDVKQEDLRDMCKSTSKFTRLCHIVSMLPAGQPNFNGNYMRVIPEDIVVPGYSSLLIDGSDNVLLLQKPTQ